MSNSALEPDVLTSVAQHVHAGNRSMARLELDPKMSWIDDQATSWLWKAWLAESPDAARSALQIAHEIDRSNEVIAAGLTFVQGLLDWKPTDVETDFDVDPEFLVNPNHNQAVAPIKADLDVETDFDVDPEFDIDQIASDESVAEVVDGAWTESCEELGSQQPAVNHASSLECDSPNQPILVVDDSQTIRKLISLTLSTLGYEVMTAADGAEALQKIANRRPALVLSDTVMPKLDGYKLCRLMKKHEATQDIPVILLSENDGIVEKLRTSMVGCRDRIAKPFESKTLIEKIRKHTCMSQGPAPSLASGKGVRNQ